MKLFENPFLIVSQGFFSGWKVQDKLSGTIAIPNSMLKTKIGLVWMQVRRTKKAASVDSNMSEEVMFGSFGQAVLDPTSVEGLFWFSKSADELADFFIASGNEYMRQAARSFSRSFSRDTDQ